jgi:hypothetical protein
MFEEQEEDLGALVTGSEIASRRYGCPAEDGCKVRFWRVYDVRRHLKGDHGLDLEDLEVRRLLSRKP